MNEHTKPVMGEPCGVAAGLLCHITAHLQDLFHKW